MGDREAVAMLVAAMILAALGGIFYFHQYADCNARGGVLVKNAYDWPTCVQMRSAGG